MKIEPINRRPDVLIQVKDLWRANSRTLGPLPNGAFEEYARNGSILVAIDHSASCMGYLLFRHVTQRNEIAITHLCVDKARRGLRIGHELVSTLKAKTTQTRGIGLWCRRDYEATSIWPHFGFVCYNERAGRGRDGSLLNFWWFDHGNPDLFRVSAQDTPNSKAVVAIDANVFISLANDKQDLDDDVAALQSDWVLPEVEYCITTETFNEISRCNSIEERKRQKRIAMTQYRALPTNDSEFSRIRDSLDQLLGASDDESEKSDRRQLARAASGGADFFVTNDAKLVETGLANYELLQLTVLRPSEFVTRIDSLLRASEYRPTRLRGSYYVKNRDAGGSLGDYLKCFLRSDCGERRVQLKGTLESMLACPQYTEISVIRDPNNAPIGLLGLDLSSPDYVLIRLCRITNGAHAKTMAYQLLGEAAIKANKEKRRWCAVDDPFPSNEVKRVAGDLGFFRLNNRLVKLNVHGTHTRQDAAALIHTLARESGILESLERNVVDNIGEILAHGQNEKIIATEKTLRPLKLEDIGIPTYVIPIKSAWAAQLFDDDLANGDIFGAQPDLIFRITNVYYRAPHQCGLTAPARILWYVKKNPREAKTMTIRACSYLDEVIIDSPKHLFARFQRLGVYKWRNVAEIGEKSGKELVMAITFSHTERFETPISLGLAHQILSNHGMKKNHFQSPVAIPNQAFLEIYRAGAS